MLITYRCHQRQHYPTDSFSIEQAPWTAQVLNNHSFPHALTDEPTSQPTAAIYTGNQRMQITMESAKDSSKSSNMKEILARLGGIFPMDEEAVLKLLPMGTKLIVVEKFGVSAFTATGRIKALEPTGGQKEYFIKVAYGEQGRVMLNGEAMSSLMIYDLMPDFIPKPVGFGAYQQEQAAYFYLSEFVDMDVTTPPDPVEWTKRLANMHKQSQSPTGQFGFPVKTCDGKTAHTTDWEESWAVFYRTLFLGVCKRDIKANGSWPELELAAEQIANAVIPQLLDNLKMSDGQKIKPCIIHGDLWEGNMGISKETNKSLLFDAGSYFAHNEMELGHWRCEFSTVFRDKSYTEHYQQNYPPAEPVEEFDDRNRLYSLKGAIVYSAGHPQSSMRKTAYNNMLYLIEKYAPLNGVDKYDPNIDPSITGTCIVPHLAEGFI